MNPHLAARRMIHDLKAEEDQGERSDEGNTQGHLLWMLHQLSAGEVRNDKAHRWLGYAQGLAVMLGLVTLEQMKLTNLGSQDTPAIPEDSTGRRDSHT